MGKTLDKRSICFKKTKIALGEAVATFFMSRGYSDIVLEYNYADSSLIMEGMNSNKAIGYKYVIPNGISISSVQPYKKQNNLRWVFDLESSAHLRILDMTKRDLIFRVKKISEDKLLIENLPFVKPYRNGGMIIEGKDYKLIFHSFRINKNQASTIHEKSQTKMLMDKLIKRNQDKLKDNV